MESASPRRIAASRGLGLRGGSGRRAFAPSGPPPARLVGGEGDFELGRRRAIARVAAVSARLNGSRPLSGLAPGLRLVVGLTSTVGMRKPGGSGLNYLYRTRPFAAATVAEVADP